MNDRESKQFDLSNTLIHTNTCYLPLIVNNLELYKIKL